MCVKRFVSLVSLKNNCSKNVHKSLVRCNLVVTVVLKTLLSISFLVLIEDDRGILLTGRSNDFNN